jgi:hypothetical protein
MKYKDKKMDVERINYPNFSLTSNAVSYGGLVPAFFWKHSPSATDHRLQLPELATSRKYLQSGGGFMAGKIRQMIDAIINQRAKDNPMLERVIKTKLILKGINPNRYTLQSDDDPTVIGKLEKMMQDLR